MSTVPGTIPDLIRPQSPVRLRGRRGVMVQRDLDRPGDVWVALLYAESWAPVVLRATLAALELDLTQPTGQAHAAWWVHQRPADVLSFQAYAQHLPLLETATRGGCGPVEQARLRDLVLRLAGVSDGR